MRSQIVSFYCVIVGIASFSVCAAQTGSNQAPPPPSTFAQLFPHPTGHNGYEEIVAAGDRILQNAALDAAEGAESTLTQKRAVLADPACRQALALLRAGLAKPMQTPRTGKASVTTPVFGEFRNLRRLGCLLKVEQYVYCADGRISAAILSLSDAFRLTDAIRTENIFGSLAADAVDQSDLYAFSFHMDQWSLADCSRVLRLVSDRLAMWPNPGGALLKGELRYTFAALEEITSSLAKSQGAGNPETDSDPDISPENRSQVQREWQALGSDLTARQNAYAEMRCRISDAFDREIASNPFAPAVSRAQQPEFTPTTLSDRLVRNMTATLPKMREIPARRHAELRLLAVHAAIRRYRWEYNRLPATLAELNMPDLITDPYTGNSLPYEVIDSGRVYILVSARRRDGEDAKKSELRLPPASDLWR